MGHNFFKQSQFELFPHSRDEKAQDLSKGRVELKDLTLSIENIILLSIIFVMGFVLFFSFGVERGKRLAKRSIDTIEEITDVPVEATVESVVLEGSDEAVIDLLGVAEGNEIREVIQIEVPQTENTKISENIFTIQVASFKLEENARKEVDGLKQKGFDSYVVSKGSHSIVCVGKFSERSKAKQFASKLEYRYKDYLVRRL